MNKAGTSKRLSFIFGGLKDSHRVFTCLLGHIQRLVGSACNILRSSINIFEDGRTCGDG